MYPLATINNQVLSRDRTEYVEYVKPAQPKKGSMVAMLLLWLTSSIYMEVSWKRATPIHRPFLIGIFHEKKPAIGVPLWLGNLHVSWSTSLFRSKSDTDFLDVNTYVGPTIQGSNIVSFSFFVAPFFCGFSILGSWKKGKIMDLHGVSTSSALALFRWISPSKARFGAWSS